MQQAKKDDFSIGIVFSKSNSSNFKTAHKRALSLSEFGDFSVEKNSSGTETRFHLVITNAFVENAVRIDNLKRLVYSWKGTELFVNGEPSTKREFEVVVEYFLELRRCWNTQKRNIMSKGHPCIDEFAIGCKYLRLDVKHEFLKPFQYCIEPPWFAVGDFANGVVTIDKELIKKQINNTLKSKRLYLCPLYDKKDIDNCIARLPNALDPSDNPEYSLIYELGKEEPVWVIPKIIRCPYNFSLQKNEKTSERYGGLTFDFQSIQRKGEEPDIQQTRIIPSVRYDDIRGQDGAVESIRDYVELPIIHGDMFECVGVESGKGVLLYGPPGNGKTLLAKAVAGETGSHIEIISGPEILSKWVGESERNLRELFERARRLEPSIILIDEIDSIASSRETAEFHHQKLLVSQMLVLLDGLEARGRVVVIATTNRLDDIDPAIKRPGRFDRMVYVGQPDDEGRKDIFKKYISTMSVGDDINLEVLSSMTKGYSGAEIEHTCREAGMLCIKEAIKLSLQPKDILVRDIHFKRVLKSKNIQANVEEKEYNMFLGSG